MTYMYKGYSIERHHYGDLKYRVYDAYDQFVTMAATLAVARLAVNDDIYDQTHFTEGISI